MLFRVRTIERRARKFVIKFVMGTVVLLLAGMAFLPAAAETFDVPSFRKGLWLFARKIEYPDHRVVVREEEIIRCVDPTRAMQGIFSSPNLGNCQSTNAERIDNRYTFANRCDYSGPVRTDITVHSDESYTELNFLKAGHFPKVDSVSAQRIGDCDDPQATRSDSDFGAAAAAVGSKPVLDRIKTRTKALAADVKAMLPSMRRNVTP